jgi:hypothetical protein
MIPATSKPTMKWNINMKHMQVVPPQILPLGKMNMTKNDDASDKEDWFHMSRPDKIGTCHPDL